MRAVFDFGLFDRTCAIYDLTIVIELTAISWLRLRLGRGDDRGIAEPEAAPASPAGYIAVRTLGRDERETLVRLLPFVHVESALSEIEYFVGAASDCGSAVLAWNDYLLGHAA